VIRLLWTVGVIALGLCVYLVCAGAIRKFTVPGPPEPDPGNVRPVDQSYRCSVCGAEVTMTVASNVIEPDAPRHCREDMIPIT